MGRLDRLRLGHRIGRSQIGHHHLGTLFSQALAVGRTQQTGTAGHHHHLAGEIESLCHVVS